MARKKKRPTKRQVSLPASLPTAASKRPDRSCDVLVVGAGAAGLLAALAARGVLGPGGESLPVPPNAADVVLLNNESRLGLKILVSGGGRCNLTNAQVTEADYDTDAPHLVRRLLRGFPSASIRAFFEGQGCRLYEEPLGKIFPRSDNAGDVLRVLLEAVVRAEIPLIAPAEVVNIQPAEAGLEAKLADGGIWKARRVVLATGGKSLPKTGSRGFGLQLLSRLGHELAPAFPALTPLLLDPKTPLNGLAGLTVPAVLTLAPLSAEPEQLAGKKFRPLARSAGSLLVTHKGATGPAPFDVSGPCGRAKGDPTRLSADFWTLTLPEGPWAAYRDDAKAPGASLRPAEAPRPPSRELFEAQAKSLLNQRQRSLLQVFAERLPKSLLQGLFRVSDLDPSQPIKQLDTRARTRLWLALTQADLRVVGSEGYAKAEVTAGGVRLDELLPATLESRRCPGLYCCGEVVNVTGRLGGFNFQWAWSSGFAAGQGAAKAIASAP
jgi:predicted Rossmann fold flavoprotein